MPEAGGSECVLFSLSGELRFDGLSYDVSSRLKIVLDNLSSRGAEAKPIPAGHEAPSNLRVNFERVSDNAEDARRKYRGCNPHYSLCAGEGSFWTHALLISAQATISDVRSGCLMKCRAASEFYSLGGDCCPIYEDGEFVSASAQRAVE